MSPTDNLWLDILAIVLSAAVAAVVGSVLLGFGRNEKVELVLKEARAQRASNKLDKPAQTDARTGPIKQISGATDGNNRGVKREEADRCM
ncbi:hypothetical protein GCM10007382_01210 [Salinibacterium xinjiangense]|uniref:Uncharacterized protein n=1 Tax=Salinibacterium xinjiangense TaxID=386302 RepID=A0A2C9A2W6_9MICO|nr:hypothetical protein [Salinibacterium xinjiangense]GGK85032.1 hypothetical protein GCM10007382_01210 [Salinibacterium xinjiangense]SOE73719.1 hypothetical protein SAMN06296378_2819 [Salinibacterium xinjiangense]